MNGVSNKQNMEAQKYGEKGAPRNFDPTIK